MGGPPDDATNRQTRLSQALKALRRRRGLGAAALAKALGMKVRSYQHFESGRSRVNVERVHQIARALDADGHAILIAAELGSPAFAVRAADNKLMTIIVMALRDFDASVGDQISQLDARLLTSVFERTFNELALLAKDRSAAAQRWRGPPGGEEPEDGAS
jgi:transcriptional regulator with XRE-family HTH domain